ncbi:cyd operon YbgE family protein [Otariodibacter sp.]|uniref:cyd operon YbgE family protein n=1 Tax=Otariodibacter sp. TaxID=3030919 RepID=UPI002602CB69|nr:cyd operon YbgE family protein [Otariodibacter sp.]
MIDSLYNLTRKGWLKALSFIISTSMFILIWVFSSSFALHFGGHIPYFALFVFYGMVILWIHGIGFEIKSSLFRIIFLPFLGYIIVLPSFLYFIFSLLG